MSDYAGEYSGAHGGCSGLSPREEETFVDYNKNGTGNASEDLPAAPQRELYKGKPWSRPRPEVSAVQQSDWERQRIEEAIERRKKLNGN